MTPEGKVKKKVKKFLDDNKIYYVMTITGGFGNSGAPDFLCCHRGYFIGIECKANGNTPTALQKDNMDRIVESGGRAFVVDEDLVDLLDDIFEMR